MALVEEDEQSSRNSNKNIRNAKGAETDFSCSNRDAKDGSRDWPGASEQEGGNQSGGKEEDVDETDLSGEVAFAAISVCIR